MAVHVQICASRVCVCVCTRVCPVILWMSWEFITQDFTVNLGQKL